MVQCAVATVLAPCLSLLQCVVATVLAPHLSLLQCAVATVLTPRLSLLQCAVTTVLAPRLSLLQCVATTVVSIIVLWTLCYVYMFVVHVQVNTCGVTSFPSLPHFLLIGLCSV